MLTQLVLRSFRAGGRLPIGAVARLGVPAAWGFVRAPLQTTWIA